MGEVNTLKKQIKELSERIIFLESNIQKNQKDIIKQALTEFTNQKNKDNLKSEFLRKFNQNKKTLIKQKIIEIIKIKPTSVADLKYHIVNQLNYCSKASFYRYISEMKEDIEIKNNIAYFNKKVLV